MLTAAITGVVDHPCIKHVTSEMTLRHARLESPTIRDAYDAAMAKLNGRRSLFTIPAGASRAVPSKIDWLHREMLKTRVAHGFCSRDPVAGPCPYAKICEHCDNFVPDRVNVLVAQRDDAQQRGWADEAARHQRALDTHLRHLDRTTHPDDGDR